MGCSACPTVGGLTESNLYALRDREIRMEGHTRATCGRRTYTMPVEMSMSRRTLDSGVIVWTFVGREFEFHVSAARQSLIVPSRSVIPTSIAVPSAKD